jgi:hypothetical protein
MDCADFTPLAPRPGQPVAAPQSTFRHDLRTAGRCFSRSASNEAKTRVRCRNGVPPQNPAADKGRGCNLAGGSDDSLPASKLGSGRFAKKGRAFEHLVVQSENFVESHGGKLGDRCTFDLSLAA